MPPLNIARRLSDAAARWPDRVAVVASRKGAATGDDRYRRWTFRQLDDESTRLVAGLRRLGVPAGSKLVLFVPFSWEFVALTFALFKAGLIAVLIDPGMGRTNIFECLEEVQPDGFVAVPVVQAIRWWKRRRFVSARFNVTVGRRWFWGGSTYNELMTAGQSSSMAAEQLDSVSSPATAAIVYTSGSTGPPKGVVYEHAMFDAQVELIRDFYGIQAGEVDLAGFPLFGLFNAAMGVTTVIPDMDPTRPAQVDPAKIVRAIEDNQVTQAFGSPALWNRVGRYCEDNHVTLPTIRRGLSAGGPAPIHVLERMSRAFSGGGADLYTPYGATESLPVASIGAREVLQRTAERTREGAGTCVGRRFPGVEVKIIEITDGPIESLQHVRELPPGEIGEIIVRGPSVTREYYARPEATRLAKIPDTATTSPGRPEFWHRIGDVGYLDTEGLLWFCGRKAHVLETEEGRMFSVCCEGIFDAHPGVYRSALVGVGARLAEGETLVGPPLADASGYQRSRQTPVVVIEPEPGRFPRTAAEQQTFRHELRTLARRFPVTAAISRFLFHPSLPVDTRHNVKIQREALAKWAATQPAVATD